MTVLAQKNAKNWQPQKLVIFTVHTTSCMVGIDILYSSLSYFAIVEKGTNVVKTVKNQMQVGQVFIHVCNITC